MPTIDPDYPGSLLGKGMGWPPREDPLTGDFVRVEDETSISESILHLIHLTPGVVPGNELMGTQVEDLLFRAPSRDFQDLAELVGESIVQAIRNYEGRVYVLGSTFTARRAQHGRTAVFARITYRVRATGEVAQGVFPFYLDQR